MSSTQAALPSAWKALSRIRSSAPQKNSVAGHTPAACSSWRLCVALLSEVPSVWLLWASGDVITACRVLPSGAWRIQVLELIARRSSKEMDSAHRIFPSRILCLTERLHSNIANRD